MNQVDYFLAKLFVPSEGIVFSLADVVLAMTVTSLLCFMHMQWPHQMLPST